MADVIGTRNKLNWGSQQEKAELHISATGTYSLPSISLPNISNATIQLVRLKFRAQSYRRANNGFNGLAVQIKKGAGAWTDAITFNDVAMPLAADDNTKVYELQGHLDMSSVVDVFNQSYDVRLNVTVWASDVYLYLYWSELEVYYTLDSGVEAKIDIIDTNVDDVEADTADMQPRVVAIETDTDITIPATLTTIEGKIDTIDTEVGVIDGIVDDIKEAIITISGAVVADGGNTASTFKTNLAETSDDFYNNIQILFISGNNAGQARRITDYDGTTKFITVSEAFDAAPAGTDDFLIIARVAGAGSALTEAGIADAVLEESVDAHKGVANSLAEHIDEIQIDTNEIQGKLPSKATLRGTADADGGMDTEDKADIESECGDALTAFDTNGVASKNQLDAAETAIIAEIDANETKIDNLDADLVTHDTDIKALIGTPAVDVSADIADLDSDLATHDVDIKALIGTPSVDISADIAANLAAIQAVQNNTRFTAAVPNPMQKPDAGNQAYRHASNLYDTQGDMEDPDNSEILVRIIKNDGTFITANLYKENALSTALDDPTDTGTFPPASGWRAMEREAVGKYFFFYKVASTETEEALTVEFGWDEGGQVNYQSRATKISDVTGDIEDIQVKVDAIYVKTAAVSPSPTIPGQITTHDTDIKALPNVKATPEYLVVPSGLTAIDLEGGITDVQTTIPVKDASQLEDEGVVLIESEYVIYTSKPSGVLTGCTRGAYSSSNVAHADNINVYEVLVYPLRLVVHDNEGNMVAPDSAPTIEIKDWNGNQELAPTVMTLISTGLYGYNYIVAATERPEPKTLNFVIVVSTITTRRQSTLMLLDEPATEVSLIQLVGGGSGKLEINQDGYFDASGIFHAWTDAMVGYLHDDTGSRLSDVTITAYEVIGGEIVRAVIPPGQAESDNGNYEMRLNAGTYIFKFDHDQYRFPVPEVTRTVTE